MKKYPSCYEPPKRVWDLPTVGVVTLRRPPLAELTAADAAWEAERRASDTHGWQWGRVMTEVRDCVYSLSSETRAAPVALYGTSPSLKTLGQTRILRLNYYQIAPQLRGGEIASLGLAILARAATEWAAEELVLGALPSPKVVQFYLDLGASNVAPQGWTVAKGLTPIWFPRATLTNLAEVADALEKEA